MTLHKLKQWSCINNTRIGWCSGLGVWQPAHRFCFKTQCPRPTCWPPRAKNLNCIPAHSLSIHLDGYIVRKIVNRIHPSNKLKSRSWVTCAKFVWALMLAKILLSVCNTEQTHGSGFHNTVASVLHNQICRLLSIIQFYKSILVLLFSLAALHFF